jgi:hypothetical protein
MPVKIFVPQDQVDTWVTTDKVDLAGEAMTFRQGRISLRVVPACFFKNVSVGSDQGHGLLGRAKTNAALSALGAEVCMNSVIIADTAYDVEPGIVAKPIDGACTRQALIAAMLAVL